MGLRGDAIMIISFSVDNLISQYSFMALPFIVLMGGILFSRFKIGAFK